MFYVVSIFDSIFWLVWSFDLLEWRIDDPVLSIVLQLSVDMFVERETLTFVNY